MPLIKEADEVLVTEQPNNVQIAASTFRGVTVDTRYIPSSSLLTHIEGSSWTVNYYSQVLNADNQVQGQNLSLSPLYQQYKLVRSFEFKVTSPLTSSQDANSKSMQVTGAANIYPFLIPNVGDMFIADIGDGREAVFKVTSSERRAIYKDTAHAVGYVLIDYQSPERAGDFDAKTVETVVFVKDFLEYSQNPLLHEADYQAAKTLESRYRELLEMYFHSFASNEFKTLLVPFQVNPVYDAFLTKAIKAVFTTWDSPQLQTMRELNVSGDDAMKSITLWDALVSRRKSLLRSASRRTGLVIAHGFSRDPMLDGIYYSGVRYVVYPKDPTPSADVFAMGAKKPLSDTQLINGPTEVTHLDELLNTIVLQGLPEGNTPLIKPILEDDYYVLSQAFYRGDVANLSRLESCVMDYLDHKALNYRTLLAFCDNHYSWGALERFYYVPVILMLIKANLRSM